MRTLSRLLVLGLVTVLSCDQAPGPEVNTGGVVVLEDFSFSPQRLVYALLPSEQIIGDSIAVPLSVGVTVMGSGASAQDVRYVVQSSQSALDPLYFGTLQREGQNRYMASLTLMLLASDVQTYTILVYVTDGGGRITGEVRGLLEYVRVFEPGSPPSLDMVVVPDTIMRPAQGQPAVSLLLAVDVSDPDGLVDVERVEFWNMDLPETRILMCDQGGDRPCGASEQSGDLVAGDGRFTRRVFIASTNVLGLNTLVFQATDRAGLTSQERTKDIVIVQ